jgi:DNA-binding transcriptional regulator YhcF (GntR family)
MIVGEGRSQVREMAGLDEDIPLFVQVAERLSAEIADGGLAEGERVPSSNELAVFYRINPATAAKGINMLTDEGLLEKHRGIGMFVSSGARQRLLERRRKRFMERYVEPLVTEAARLGIGTEELAALIREAGHSADHVEEGVIA